MTATHAIARIRQAAERVTVTGGVALLVLAVFPLFDPGNYLLHIAALVFVYAALGLGLNIVVGLAGLLDLGFVAFYAVGAYGLALLTSRWHVPFPVAAMVAMGTAALIGVALGWPTIRTSGDYLALVTLGFGEMVRLLIRNWVSVTNGPQGLMNVPPPSLGSIVFASPVHYYYLGLLMGAATLVLFWRVKCSSAGLQLRAIRDDEAAAVAVGINPIRWKLYAFALGALVAGMAGVFFASWQRFVSPESFTLNESILVLSIVVLGGMGRLWPTVCAAAFLVILPEALRGLETYRALVLGSMLIAVVIAQESLRRRHGGKTEATDIPIPDTKRLVHETRLPTAVVWPQSDGRESALLSISSLRKSFGGIKALNDVSLDICRGEILGIVGANGAGKTTLFSCLVGSLPPDSGEIWWEGQGGRISLPSLPAYQRARLGLIHTFQQPRLFGSLTALQNVEIGAQCRDVPPLWAPMMLRPKERTPEHVDSSALLGSVGAPAAATSVASMSFVEQKRTELTRALATRPALLLVDEPAAGMGPAARACLADLLRRVNRQMGTAIVVIEHDLGFLTSICTRLMVLDRGRVAAVGAPNDATVLSAIVESYQPKGTKHEVA